MMSNTLSSTFNAIVLAGSAKDDFWAANDNAQTVRYTGASFVNISNPMLNPIRGIYARSNTEAWFDGTSIETPNIGVNDPLPTTNYGDLKRIWAASAIDIWATGISGLLIRYQPGR